MYTHQIDTFMAVCRYGSFTRTAKECYITPSAVVQQMNLLEKRLGVKLFLRTNHGITLTPAGEILRKESADFIRHADGILEKMKKAGAHRPVRLGWTTGVEDSHFLSECLALRDAHEGLQIELTRISGSVREGLMRHEFDLCQYVHFPCMEAYGYVFTPLYDVCQCIVVPEGHPLQKRERVELEDLSGMELVLLAQGVLTDHDEFRRLVRERSIPVRLIEVENYDFDTRADCYNRKLSFLGMEPLRHQYAPLTSIPAAWAVPVHIGLISQKADWEDLNTMVREMAKSY